MRVRDVATCFLQHNGRILVLKRSDKVRTHRGKWAGVSGSIEEGTPLKQALVEIREEVALEEGDVLLLRQGQPLDIPDAENDVLWRVHPFLFDVKDPARVSTDWEHVEHRWIEPSELDALDTVPKLKETWEQLWKR